MGCICEVSWGSVADWVSAIGSAGAAIGALSAWYFSRKEVKELRAETERKTHAARRQVERAQAVEVGAWVVTLARRTTGQLHLVNRSPSPVFDVEVSGITGSSGSLAPFSLPFVMLPPGTDGERSEVAVVEALSLAMTFRDAVGRWWRKDASFRLYRWTGDQAPTAEERVKSPLWHLDEYQPN